MEATTGPEVPLRQPPWHSHLCGSFNDYLDQLDEKAVNAPACMPLLHFIAFGGQGSAVTVCAVQPVRPLAAAGLRMLSVRWSLV